MKTVWLLTEGCYSDDFGIVVCASTTKKKLLSHIKEKYPSFQRIPTKNNEIYLENITTKMWLRCKHNDKCILI